MPKISRADPAIMSPAASSDMAVTINAPGSSTASEARAVRSGPSSSPASAAANSPQPMMNAASAGTRVAISVNRPASRNSPATTTPASVANSTLAAPGCRIRQIPADATTNPMSAAQAGYLRGRLRSASS